MGERKQVLGVKARYSWLARTALKRSGRTKERIERYVELAKEVSRVRSLALANAFEMSVGDKLWYYKDLALAFLIQPVDLSDYEDYNETFININ